MALPVLKTALVTDLTIMGAGIAPETLNSDS